MLANIIFGKIFYNHLCYPFCELKHIFIFIGFVFYEGCNDTLKFLLQFRSVWILNPRFSSFLGKKNPNKTNPPPKQTNKQTLQYSVFKNRIPWKRCNTSVQAVVAPNLAPWEQKKKKKKKHLSSALQYSHQEYQENRRKYNFWEDGVGKWKSWTQASSYFRTQSLARYIFLPVKVILI